MRKTTAAATVALFFGAAAAWLAYRGLLAADTRVWWMLFWMAGALQLWVLTALTGIASGAAGKPLAGLGAPLVGGCTLCQLAALGGLCLRLQGPWAAVWLGAAAAALAWLALCLLALACERIP